MPGPGFSAIRLTLARIRANQLHQFARCSDRVVDLVEQHIFEGQPLAGTQRESARRGQQLLQIPFAIDRHQFAPRGVVRGIKRDRQLGPQRLVSEIVNSGDDAGGRDRHARFCDAQALHQQPHRLHEVVVVQEGLALPHEDQVDAVALKRDALRSSSTAATWPTISPAVRLRCRPSSAVRQNWQFTAQPTWLETQMVARLHYRQRPLRQPRSVASFAAVAFRHPDRFDAVPVGKGNQVADGAVGGNVLLLNARLADDDCAFREGAAELERQAWRSLRRSGPAGGRCASNSCRAR